MKRGQIQLWSKPIILNENLVVELELNYFGLRPRVCQKQDYEKNTWLRVLIGHVRSDLYSKLYTLHFTLHDAKLNYKACGCCTPRLITEQLSLSWWVWATRDIKMTYPFNYMQNSKCQARSICSQWYSFYIKLLTLRWVFECGLAQS